MTGILTETANLTNSYQYDSYGNLTSGTADGVNYYGYNGESTNVKQDFSICGQDTITQRTEPLQLKIVTLERQKIH